MREVARGGERAVPTLRPESSACLEGGRDAFARGAWRLAFTELSRADGAGALGESDLARLASAAHLIGRSSESANAWERAHRAALDAGDAPAAARAAFWLSLGLLVRRNVARATGWIARGSRILDEGEHDCVERGYLRFSEALRHAVELDAPTAERMFGQAADIGARFDDRSLVALARHAQGRALIFAGDAARGAALLDETMIALGSGEVVPLFVADIYCSAIDACNEMYDVARARDWTDAFDGWCESQPDAVGYRETCSIHRAEIIRLRGDWDGATAELDRARGWFDEQPGQFGIGGAWYGIGELHRLRGAFDDADAAFRESSRAGFDPQPGLALLRLAQGKVSAAKASIRRAVDEARLWPIRSRRLPALVEIALADSDAELARQAGAELSDLAGVVRSPLLEAVAAYAAGSIALHVGDARDALANLRNAEGIWRRLNAPYESARARALIGAACRMLGDSDAACLELDAAREVFEALGARPDIGRVDALNGDALSGDSSRTADGLTAREVQVLRHIAKGETNRAIASSLRISEKTVARHVSNIFLKLRVSNRTAATSLAHERGLVDRRTDRHT